MTNTPPNRWLREFILRLFLAMMIVGLSSMPSFAENGLVYPDSANVLFTREVSFDTVVVTITNLSQDSVRHFFLADFTDSITLDVECQLDGSPCNNLFVEHETGNVYPGKYTTSWVVGAFAQTLILKYYSRFYTSNELSWSAGHPYAIFGIMPANSGIGPPRNVHWGQ